MNTSKKSFILYNDSKALFDILSIEERGILITAIFEYVNGKEIIELDKTVNMAFQIIKNYLDLNEEKYIARCEKNRDNVNKRWNTNVYERIEPNTNVYNCIESNTNEYEAIRSDTNYTDNDNVTDTDNVTENDNVTDTEKEKEKEKDNDNGNEFNNNPKIEMALRKFEHMRESMKVPLSNKERLECMAELRALSGDNTDKAVAIINQTIDNNWKKFRALMN